MNAAAQVFELGAAGNRRIAFHRAPSQQSPQGPADRRETPPAPKQDQYGELAMKADEAALAEVPAAGIWYEGPEFWNRI